MDEPLDWRVALAAKFQLQLKSTDHSDLVPRRPVADARGDDEILRRGIANGVEVGSQNRSWLNAGSGSGLGGERRYGGWERWGAGNSLSSAFLARGSAGSGSTNPHLLSGFQPLRVAELRRGKHTRGWAPQGLTQAQATKTLIKGDEMRGIRESAVPKRSLNPLLREKEPSLASGGLNSKWRPGKPSLEPLQPLGKPDLHPDSAARNPLETPLRSKMDPAGGLVTPRKSLSRMRFGGVESNCSFVTTTQLNSLGSGRGTQELSRDRGQHPPPTDLGVLAPQQKLSRESSPIETESERLPMISVCEPCPPLPTLKIGFAEPARGTSSASSKPALPRPDHSEQSSRKRKNVTDTVSKAPGTKQRRKEPRSSSDDNAGVTKAAKAKTQKRTTAAEPSGSEVSRHFLEEKKAREGLTDQERRQLRTFKNRESAIRSLMKKKNYTEVLQQQVSVLESEVEQIVKRVLRTAIALQNSGCQSEAKLKACAEAIKNAERVHKESQGPAAETYI